MVELSSAARCSPLREWCLRGLRIVSKQTPQRDEAREQRIAGLLGGAEDEYERISAWYEYLEEHVRFPFTATCTRSGGGLRLLEEVEVIDLACVDDWEDEARVTLGAAKDGLDAPLVQVTPRASSDEQTKQAVADWHYWVQQGYHFWTEEE